MTSEAPQGVPKPPFKFNLRQSQIETARGALIAAAHDYGDTPTGLRLWQIVTALTAIRDPEVVEHFEQRRMKQVQSGMEVGNG